MGVVLVLQAPNMFGEPGARLVAVPTVSLVLADPGPQGAVREAGVGLLLPGCGVEVVVVVYCLRLLSTLLIYKI